MALSVIQATAGPASFEFDALREAVRYRSALIREFAPWLSGRVVEIGAGIGQITELLIALPTVKEVIAVEPQASFCDVLRQKKTGAQVICGTVADLPLSTAPHALVSVNVLEHIDDDAAELLTWRRLLQAQSGHLCLFVPAGPEIYAPLDRDLGHYRRYTKSELKRKLDAAGLQIRRLFYFNSLGYLAWWLNFCLLKQRHFNPAAVRFYDRFLFPVVYAVESRLGPPPRGQSVLAVAQACIS
jgi:SAM-dependent methyltransferase